MIVHITSEVTPFYKRGGLGDVVGALPKYLSERHSNTVISFYYEGRMQEEYRSRGSFSVAIQHIHYEFIYYHQQLDGVDFYFLNMSDRLLFSDMESGDGDPGIEDGEKPYNNNSSYIIYLYFAKAALQLIEWLGLQPEYLFFHDWHVCGCFAFPSLLEQLGRRGACTSILLIHNYEHQGEVLPDVFHLLDEEPRGEFAALFTEFGTGTLLALGLKNADYVATVSATYAEELLNGKVSHSGLKFLRAIRRKRIYALPNGIDARAWSPETSPHLSVPYNKHSYEQVKQQAREDVLQELSLERTGGPVVLMMARLTEQKGIDIFMNLWGSEEEAIDKIRNLLDTGIRLIVCGRPSGGPSGNIHKRFSRAQELFPGRLSYLPAYSERLAHRLLAGSDAILCPSLYEPCGLVQLYGMAFGTVPVIRPVGGLRDTVVSVEDYPVDGTGFYIDAFSHDSLLRTMREVVHFYKDRPVSWSQLVKRCMEQDYSWEEVRKNYYLFFDEIRKEMAPPEPHTVS